MNRIISLAILSFLIIGCSDNKVAKKGFQVSEISENEEGEKIVGLPIDSLEIETKPGSVLLTKNPAHRLVPIYKVNYDDKGRRYSGSNNFHINWSDFEAGNNWNYNFMPGFAAMYGYNLINIAHFSNATETQNEFFEKPVLIKTLYYPAFSNDTLNFEPISRNHYMVSVYDEDTNKDGYINVKDLRRFYLFDLSGKPVKPLIPTTYSAMSSEYDSGNDIMYIYGKEDQNANGQMELEEPTHIFWIDLKSPEETGVLYKDQ